MRIKTVIKKSVIKFCIILFLFNNLFAQNDSIISLDYYVEYTDFPNVRYTIFNYDILDNGLICIPLYNGIYIAGIDSWLIEPVDKNLVVALCKSNFDNSIYIIKGNSDTMFIERRFPKIENKQPQRITDITPGFYNLQCFGVDSLILSGINDTLWSIYTYNGKKIDTLLTQTEPITGIFMLNRNSFIYSTTKDIILVQPDTDPIRLIESEVPIESFAFSEDGYMYISIDNAIYKYNSLTAIEPVILGINGLLKSFNNSIYVLSQERNQIIILSKKE